VGAAYIIESLTKVINFAFAFVPGTIGVYEAGNGIILRTLGYTTAVGVALANRPKRGDYLLDGHRSLYHHLAHVTECLGPRA
jgi:hypothetical protein